MIDTLDIYTPDGIVSVTPNMRREDFPAFPYLGSGVSREVYALSDNYVLKIAKTPDSFAGGNREEVKFCESLSEEEMHLVAKVYIAADDYSWIISERIESLEEDCERDGNFHEVRNALTELGVRDLHPANMGRREDGTWCAVDYGYQGAGWIADSVNGGHCSCDDCNIPSCDCGLCECDICAPEGCICDEWEGCNREGCERCEDDALAIRNLLEAQEAKRINPFAVAMTLRLHANLAGGRANPITLPTAAINALRLRRAGIWLGTACTVREDGNGDERNVCRPCANAEDGWNLRNALAHPQMNLWDAGSQRFADAFGGDAIWWHGDARLVVTLAARPWHANEAFVCDPLFLVRNVLMVRLANGEIRGIWLSDVARVAAVNI